MSKKDLFELTKLELEEILINPDVVKINNSIKNKEDLCKLFNINTNGLTSVVTTTVKTYSFSNRKLNKYILKYEDRCIQIFIPTLKDKPNLLDNFDKIYPFFFVDYYKFTNEDDRHFAKLDTIEEVKNYLNFKDCRTCKNLFEDLNGFLFCQLSKCKLNENCDYYEKY